jgi:hypothetical protein
MVEINEQVKKRNKDVETVIGIVRGEVEASKCPGIVDAAAQLQLKEETIKQLTEEIQSLTVKTQSLQHLEQEIATLREAAGDSSQVMALKEDNKRLAEEIERSQEYPHRTLSPSLPPPSPFSLQKFIDRPNIRNVCK